MVGQNGGTEKKKLSLSLGMSEEDHFLKVLARCVGAKGEKETRTWKGMVRDAAGEGCWGKNAGSTFNILSLKCWGPAVLGNFEFFRFLKSIWKKCLIPHDTLVDLDSATYSNQYFFNKTHVYFHKVGLKKNCIISFVTVQLCWVHPSLTVLLLLRFFPQEVWCWGSGVGLRFCISNKFPDGGADAAGPGSTLWEAPGFSMLGC